MKILINENKVKVADLNVNPVGLIPLKVLLRGVRLNYKTDEEGKRVSNEVVSVRYDVIDPSTLGAFAVRVDTPQIIDYLHDYQAKKPWYIPAYALELQIYMGCRRGELPPIKWTSVNEDGINIEAEQLTVKKRRQKKSIL
ncbi:hypothetical protein [Butyrivibrio sp. AE3006]|uniref:hypothetical protein n=1 Tax=Butyrivibrio sp. AE3006 TaxID=1280673 RepID=UPI00047AABC1|nr:hypothetical protein [Butyrivibrio sp. AE3006]